MAYPKGNLCQTQTQPASCTFSRKFQDASCLPDQSSTDRDTQDSVSLSPGPFLGCLSLASQLLLPKEGCSEVCQVVLSAVANAAPLQPAPCS